MFSYWCIPRIACRGTVQESFGKGKTKKEREITEAFCTEKEETNVSTLLILYER